MKEELEMAILTSTTVTNPLVIRRVGFSPKSMSRTFYEYRPDEFGRYQTVISPTRSKRPTASRRVGTLGFDETMAIWQSNPNAKGFDKRLHAAKISSSPEALAHILNREPDDDIRVAAAANASSPEELRYKGCAFCTFEKWGQPRGKVDGLSIGWASNPFGFGPEHDVHIANDPLHNLSDMVKHPAYAMGLIKLAFLRANAIYTHPHLLENMYWGMNYGIGRIEDGYETNSAFATFQHVHAQLINVVKGTRDPGVSVRDAIKRHGNGFFTTYLNELREKGLVISEDAGEGVALVAPWAQQSKHQLRILTPVKNFQTTDPNSSVVTAIGKAFSDALRIIKGLDVRSFNVVSYAGARKSDHQNLMIDIIPRAGIAICELGGTNVVDEYPEITAANAKIVLSHWNPQSK